GLLLGHLQSVRKAFDDDDALGAKKDRARDGELANGPRTPDGDGVARLDSAHLGTHAAGREDVRKKEHLRVRELPVYLQRAEIGKGNANVFGLAARKAAEHVRIAEDARGRVAEELVGDGGVRIRVLAERGEA